MKVTILQDFAVNGQPQFVAGEEREVNDTLAATLVERGLVEVSSKPVEPAPTVDKKILKPNKE